MDIYLPNQDVSDVEKQKERWYVPTYDYWIYQCQNAKDNSFTQTLIDASNGDIDTTLLNYLLKPFNEDAKELNEKMPIKLKSTDIITPIVETVVGEYIELPYKYSVKFHDPDLASIQDSELRAIMEDAIKSAIIERMQSQEAQENITPDQLKALVDEKKSEFIFNESLKARRFLEYINEKTDFDYYRYQMYYNWWTTEECYTYRSIEDGEFVKEVISPQKGFPYLGSSEFVDDAVAFCWVDNMTWDEFMLNDRDKLSKAQIDYLETLMGARTTNGPIYVPNVLIEQRKMQDWYRIEPGTQPSTHLTESNRTLTKYNLVFRAYRKVKELKYIDLSTNKTKTTIVPNDYKLDTSIGDLEVRNIHIPEVYYGCRYGTEHIGIYTKATKLLVQRDGKLPVTGKIGILKNKKINPVPYRLAPYQVIDMMLTFHIEKVLHKYKDDILIIPKSMLASDKGATTTEKTYYLLKDGRVVYDDTMVNLQTAVQGFRLIQGSATDKYLQTLIQIQQYFISRAKETGSLNDDRLGNIDTRSGVSNVEQNIFRSKLGNVLSLETFRKVLQKEHEADLEYAKYLFIDGLSDTMFDEKGNVIQIELNGYSNFKRSYGVHVDNGLMLDKKLNQIRQLAVSAAQNGDFDQAIKAIETDSISEIKQAVKQLKQAAEQHEAEMKEYELQRQREASQAASEMEDKKLENAEYLMELKGEIDQEQLIIGKEYDLIEQEVNIDAKLQSDQLDAETAREGNASRERIQQIKKESDKEKERIKAKYNKEKTNSKKNQ